MVELFQEAGDLTRRGWDGDSRRSGQLAYVDGLALMVPDLCHGDALMAFSLRNGGCSPPPVRSLNFSVANGDSYSNVERNLKVLTERLGIDPERVITGKQVHGDSLAVLDTVPRKLPQADALIATVPGVFPAIKTADCLPILMLDPVTKVAAAVHAGWRGTVQRITKKVLEALVKEFGVDLRDLVVSLGPAIGPCCYEVDDAVLTPLDEAIPNSDRFVRTESPRHSPRSGGRLSRRLDLTAINVFELISHGVAENHIVSANLCTACHPHLFFSHRRDGDPSGRHLSVVGFRK